MRANFAKVLVLALVLALVLSGCNLIEVDAKMQADEEIAKLEKAHAAPVASYDGGEVTIGEAVGDFNSYYGQVYNMYASFGYQMTHDDVHSMIEDVLKQKVRSEIVAAKYDAEHQLDDERMAKLEDDVQTGYDSTLESAMASAEGKDDAAKAENARVLLKEAGMDRDSIYASYLLQAKVSAMEEILRDEVAEISDEDLQAAYDAKVAEQETSFTDGRGFESAMTSDSTIVCWRPDGYRAVKHILFAPEAELKTAYSNAVSALKSAQNDLQTLEDELAAANDGEEKEGERSAEEVQAEIDAVSATVPNLETAVKTAEQACLDDVKEKADEVYEKLAAGESFEDLIDAYGEDPGMKNEPTKTRGYCVSDASQNWEPNFRDAAMALAQVGDYTTEPVVSGSGVHIILYSGDVLGGAVALDEVRDALYEETLTAQKDAHRDEVINGWIEAANPSYDVNAFEAFVEGEEE